MRARNVLVLMSLASVAVATPARADKTTDDLTAGYDKEATACALQSGGVAKVASGAAALQASLTGADHDALDADLAVLAKSQTVIDAYCGELASALELLRANPGAKYKALERQLDEHDNRIRRARADSKRAIALVEPVIHALVPRINARVAPAPDAEPQPPTKFPSGRAVVLPTLAGSWRLSGTPTADTADYVEGKLVASVWTRPFEGATCEQEKRAAAGATIDDKAGGSGDVAWRARGATKVRALAYACVAGGSGSAGGGWMGYVTIDGGEASAALREALEQLMVRMLAAQHG